MTRLNRLFLVEDQENDLKIAASAARSLGIHEVDARTTIQAARAYLEKALEGEIPMPDGIVLDLDLGYESGYELLRYWHSTPRLFKIPLVVWSVLGPEYRDICLLFKVTSFVSKWEGESALREALTRMDQAAS